MVNGNNNQTNRFRTRKILVPQDQPLQQKIIKRQGAERLQKRFVDTLIQATTD